MRSKGSKSVAIKSTSLDQLGGDVTLTDRYGMIRGTFMQRNDGMESSSHFIDSNSSMSASNENEFEIIEPPN